MNRRLKMQRESAKAGSRAAAALEAAQAAVDGIERAQADIFPGRHGKGRTSLTCFRFYCANE